MQSILIVKNIPREGPGLLGAVLKQNSLSFQMVDLAQGDVFPSPSGYGAVIVLGGPASANDPDPLMRSQIERVRQCLELGIPYLGICLGMQVLVKAAGGTVVKCAVPEIGFRDAEGRPYEVVLTETGREDPLFQGLGNSFRVFQLHGETVTFGNSTRLLASSAGCAHQAVRVGERAYGVQCHFELTEAMLEVWGREDTDLARLDRTALLDDFRLIRKDYEQTGTRLFENFLKTAGLAGGAGRVKRDRAKAET